MVGRLPPGELEERNLPTMRKAVVVPHYHRQSPLAPPLVAILLEVESTNESNQCLSLFGRGVSK